ncbi:MAG: tetratricopeptide repeat protein [Desulfovibrio sp.]|jgi:tetratricopeptide (TPR) repeat protein|nr:tetratricopeptide repeat protein [Desulfovibrio sp.]
MSAPQTSIPDATRLVRAPGISRLRPAAGLLVFLAVFLCPLPPASAGETFQQTRPFQGLVRRDMAERAAGTAADLTAMQAAMRLLAKNSDLRFAAQDVPGPLSLEGLADKLYATEVTAVGMEGFPPEVRAVVAVRLIPPENLRKALLEALREPDILELHALALRRRAELVAGYDELAERLLPLNPHNGGGKEGAHLLQYLARNMDALDLYDRVLRLSGAGLKSPKEALALLRRALALAPRDPLIRTALAEVLLALDRPAEAMDHASQATLLAPDLPRAHDVKGIILLRQGLPALAADAFGRAVALAPGKAAYRIHRASAFLIQEKTEALCADFQAACSLGDCEGYQWARTTGRCPPAADDPNSDSR